MYIKRFLKLITYHYLMRYIIEKESKTSYHKDQKFCSECNRAINNNCFNSKKMEGKCGKCYKTCFNEHERREKSKKRSKQRNNQRKYKNDKIY